MVRLNNGDSRKSVGEVSRVMTGILIANKYESGAGGVFPGFGINSLELTFLNSLTSKWIHHALFRIITLLYILSHGPHIRVCEGLTIRFVCFAFVVLLCLFVTRDFTHTLSSTSRWYQQSDD